MKTKRNSLLVGSIIILSMLLLSGCGNAAPTSAPKMAVHFKKWNELSQQEKIDTIEHSPAPNKAAMITNIKAGKM